MCCLTLLCRKEAVFNPVILGYAPEAPVLHRHDWLDLLVYEKLAES